MTNTTELDRRPLERLVMPLSFGSLFAGIGGFDLGFERAGMVCKWQVEIDEYANRVLAKHWPKVRRHDDVRTWPQPDTDHVDIICGGFPCQDISNAGRRAGIDGERSGLWSEFARIIGEVRPSIVVVENVEALLVRGIDRVLGDLAALGFDAEWDRVPAWAVGAPHRRWRLFLVAYASSVQPERRRDIRDVGSATTGDEETSWQRQRVRDAAVDRGATDVADTESIGWEQGRAEPDGRNASGGRREDVPDAESRWSGQRWREQFAAYCEGQRNIFWPEVEPPVCGVVDGVPRRVDRLRCLGNAVMPQIAEWIGRRIIEAVESAA